MALVTFGTNITQASGSAGGSVYSRNRGGAYIRARVAPLNPKSVAQQTVRNNFGSLAQNWSTALGDSDRMAWTLFAQAYPQVNTLGASIILSGLAMFMKLNQVLAQIGATFAVDPPTDLSVPPIAAPIGYGVNSTVPSAIISTEDQVATDGSSYYVFATGPLSAGRKPQTNDYRFIAALPPVAAASQVDISSYLEDLYGAMQSGKVYGVLVSAVNITTGATTVGLPFVTTSI